MIIVEKGGFFPDFVESGNDLILVAGPISIGESNELGFAEDLFAGSVEVHFPSLSVSFGIIADSVSVS